ncbi:MAG: aminotransferase, partial [Myxococcota bacterium]
RSAAFECEILQGAEGLKPGWVRLSFNYFISETTFRFLVNAVLWVAEHGWRMVPEYRFCPESGAWRHRVRRSEPAGSLESLSFRHGSTRPSQRREPESRLQNYLDEANAIVERCQLDRQELDDELTLEPSFERLRWFWLPSEARALASQTSGEL